VRNGIFLLMCLVFGVYFLYDGWIGYPHKNFEENRLQLPVEHRDKADGVTPLPGANLQHAAEIKKRLDAATASQRREALDKVVGGPPSVELDDALYYFGEDGLIKVRKSGDRIFTDMEVIPAKKTQSDFLFQKILGVIVSGVAIYVAFFLLRVVRTRAVVNDEGLSLNGRAPIPFSVMRSFDTAEFRRKGKIHLLCEGAPSPRVLLDEYHFADFDQIIAAICERTGFADPVAEEKAEKAAKAAANAANDAE